MLDKNGVEIKTGDIVEISGAYFKNDNGLYFVTHSPGDPTWSGRDYSLKRISKYLSLIHILQVGAVTTGGDAQVVANQTESGVSLDFVLPIGPVGPQGGQGPQGCLLYPSRCV